MEKAILVALSRGRSPEMEASLAELRELARTAGAQIVSEVVQERSSPDPAFYIGSGKAVQIAGMVKAQSASLVIFNELLKPNQYRNLDETIPAKIVDRPGLILDIFSQRARTNEGKIQVELAQMNYMLPRLTGKGVLLSQQGGGIGTRGPGETKLETDRRRIRHRIHMLKQSLEKIRNLRGMSRKKRQRDHVPVFALVGYTNAGKTTLFNALTKGNQLADDRLFATLDPATRQLYLGQHQQTVLLTDTVGFISHLPVELVAAFKATLEEITEADVLVHVVDASHPGYSEQVKTVREILADLKCGDKPVLMVFNKSDLLKSKTILNTIRRENPEAFVCSALHGDHIQELGQRLGPLLARPAEIKLRIPYSRSSVHAFLKQKSFIVSERYGAKGVTVTAAIPHHLLGMVEEFRMEKEKP